MKSLLSLLAVLVGLAGSVGASPMLQDEILGKSFGGWKAKGGRAADYQISGSKYRTWRPHVTPTLDGGMFVSVRIDHLRGVLASDDHASLELSFSPQGDILTAQSTIALQGRKITSDVVESTTRFGTSASGVDRVVKVGTDLVASLTAKLLREKITEPGRVGFPAAVRHNYNLLCLAIHRDVHKAVAISETSPTSGEENETPETSADPETRNEETVRSVPENPAQPAPAPVTKKPAPAPELKIILPGKSPAKNTSKRALPK